MAKLVKKSKCKFEAGRIVKKGKLIGLPYPVWCQLNKIEIMAQQYGYLYAQDAYNPGPSLKGFKRKSALKDNRPYVSDPETPVMDRRIDEAMKFMEETDKVNDAAKINEAIDQFGDLIDWCASDKFITGDCHNLIDVPTIGNPLTLSPEEIVDFLTQIIVCPIEMEG